MAISELSIGGGGNIDLDHVMIASIAMKAYKCIWDEK